MNYREFQRFRTRILAENPDVIDFAETNLWNSLASLVPRVTETHQHVHRCHLAEMWLANMQLPASWAGRAMVSSGVRHSLQLLLSQIANRSITLAIPEDVYPVYGRIADRAGVSFESYPTIPDLQLPDRDTWLLIANPLKPAGRWLFDDEVEQILRWLSVDSSRRVLIDAVYNFPLELHQSTTRLLESGQAFLLHSLSKGWLSPQVMGICLLPESDLSTFASVFQKHSPDPENLCVAQILLSDYRDLPVQVEATIESKFRRVSHVWQDQTNETLVVPAGRTNYMVSVYGSFERWLERHGILTIPLNVFGSTNGQISVVSCL